MWVLVARVDVNVALVCPDYEGERGEAWQQLWLECEQLTAKEMLKMAFGDLGKENSNDQCDVLAK